jgi:hypothetical protein
LSAKTILTLVKTDSVKIQNSQARASQIKWTTNYQTYPVTEWSITVQMVNGPDFKWSKKFTRLDRFNIKIIAVGNLSHNFLLSPINYLFQNFPPFLHILIEC